MAAQQLNQRLRECRVQRTDRQKDGVEDVQSRQPAQQLVANELQEDLGRWAPTQCHRQHNHQRFRGQFDLIVIFVLNRFSCQVLVGFEYGVIVLQQTALGEGVLEEAAREQLGEFDEGVMIGQLLKEMQPLLHVLQLVLHYLGSLFLDNTLQLLLAQLLAELASAQMQLSFHLIISRQGNRKYSATNTGFFPILYNLIPDTPMDRLLSQIQAAPQTAYSLLSTVLLTPPREVWGLLGLALCIASIVSYFLSRYEESAPNEWLLVIKNGQQRIAKVGLKTFVMPNESVVRFPSVMQRIEFKAMNVTKEMQGVSIEGYAFWQVYREGDGPFRCYKYMQGYGANDNVKTLCESIVRNELANSHLNDVITKRDQLRENVKNELMPQLQGWGIWLETVELTEVKICSGKLFEDLQAEFRQETSLTANQKKITTNEMLTKSQLTSQLKMTKTEEESKSQKQIDYNRQELKRKQQEVEFYEKTCALEKKKIENETKLQQENIARDFEINRQRLANEQQNERERKNFEFETAKREIQLAKQHTPLTLEKYTIDSNERIYRQLKMGETRINQFMGSEDPKSLSLGCLLPGLTLPPTRS